MRERGGSARWAVSLTGHGIDSIPVWSGAPALFPGVPMSVDISTAVLFQNLQPLLTVCNGSRIVANGRIAVLNRLQVKSFFAIEIIKARPVRRMASPIMSVLWRNAKTALSTLSRVILTIVADGDNTPVGYYEIFGYGVLAYEHQTPLRLLYNNIILFEV